jgi:hypothetical protein
MSLVENRPSLSDVSTRVDLQAQSNNRLVAILNILEMTKVHGGHKTWTADYAQALRTMTSLCDRLAESSEQGHTIKSV